jgi:hypothetical protein
MATIRLGGSSRLGCVRLHYGCWGYRIHPILDATFEASPFACLAVCRRYGVQQNRYPSASTRHHRPVR